MDRETRLKAIKTHISLLAGTEEDAYALLNDLLQEDWAVLIQTHQKRYEMPCVICGTMALFRMGPTSGVCKDCYPSHYTLIHELCTQRTRALKKGLPATLTLREWMGIVSSFHGKCAYCLKRDENLKFGVLIEHFIPVELGGGTTKGNCVPACHQCNRIKRENHPLEVLHLLPSGSVQRVQDYLHCQLN